jgi:beta-lactamase regulating signal transducer with metallopeptidase domain
MIAEWMLYCALCALGLAVAATLAERLLLAGRAAVRLVWIGAVALSLMVPAVAMRYAAVPAQTVPVTGSAGTAQAAATTPDVAAPEVAATHRAVEHSRNWRATLARYDAPLAIVWATLSFAVAFNLFAGVVALAWLRRRWRRETILGIPVHISERTGPAVVGVLSPAIVLPEWVLGLDPSQLALMLRHEQEHQRAGDGRLLTGAQLALIVMPWNLAIWWQILRLRVAVEMDCDARVLRNADARSYGDLLLEVARPRLRPGFVGATAFAERATQLERRIRVLARHRMHTTRAARALVAAIALVVVSAAWIAPHPSAPVRLPVASVVLQKEVPPPPPPTPNVGPAAAPVPPPKAPRPRRVIPKPPAVSIAAPSCGRAARGPDSLRVVDVIFDRLFDGIALTANRSSRACDELERLQQEQFTADEANRQAVEASRPKMAALRSQRDSALRSLLTSEAAQSVFDANLAQSAAGGRGRSGGPPPDGGRGARSGGPPPDGGRGGRSGGPPLDSVVWLNRGGLPGGGARQGGRGPSGRGDAVEWVESRLALVSNLVNNLTMRSLFDGIALTPEQDARARDLIASAQREIDAQRPRPDVRLRMNPATGIVSIRAPRDSTLMSLVPNDAERDVLRSRMLTIPR